MTSREAEAYSLAKILQACEDREGEATTTACTQAIETFKSPIPPGAACFAKWMGDERGEQPLDSVAAEGGDQAAPCGCNDVPEESHLEHCQAVDGG